MNGKNIRADVREKGGLKLLDIAIILAVIAVAITLFVRIIDKKVKPTGRTECEIGYTLNSVRYEFQDILSERELLMTEDGEEFGTLDTMTVTPAVFYGTNQAGEIVEARYPEDTLVDISGRITSQLYKTDNGFITADGKHIAAGTVIKLRTRTADITITVTYVESAK